MITWFLLGQDVEEDPEDAIYPPLSNVAVDGVRGHKLMQLEQKAMYESYFGFMYKTKMLRLWICGRPTMKEEINVVHLQYRLNDHARMMCRIGPTFVEPIDDDVNTKDEFAQGDLDVEDESEEEEGDVVGDVTDPTGEDKSLQSSDPEDLDDSPSSFIAFVFYDILCTGDTA